MKKPAQEIPLIFILNSAGQWEEKSNAVAKFSIDETKALVRISYKSNPKHRYTYKQDRVRISYPKAIFNPAEVQLRVSGELIFQADSIIQYPEYYAVFKHGSRKLHPESDVTVEHNISTNSDVKSALEYFHAISDLISIKTDDGQAILAGQYKHLKNLPATCALAAYLRPESPLSKLEPKGPLVYPFGTNASQKTAVEKAFRSQVTLIQGPPGTGKTQTILNIVANSIRFGQTVAIASNNNTATKNVAEKLTGKDLAFLLAPLGKRANKEAFIQGQNGYPKWISEIALTKNEIFQLENQIAILTAKLDELVKANNDRAELATQLSHLKAEAELQEKVVNTKLLQATEAKLKRWKAAEILEVLVECEEHGSEPRSGLLHWLKDILRYGIFLRKIRRELFAAGPLVLRGLYYTKSIAELRDKLTIVENILSKNDFSAIQKKVEKKSWELLRANIADRYRNKNRPIFSENELWKNYASFLTEYPVILSTTHSLKTSLSPDCLYDLVIIDEASQVDVATGVLALSCAKRAVIVGDEKQLPNVIPEEVKLMAAQIWKKYAPKYSAWNYGENSLLSSAMSVWPQAPNVLLREHYRCHPKIAGFFNRQFYDNQLIVMTEDHGEADAMQAMFTVPGNHARGRINQRQIDVISQEILPAFRKNGITDIGIIAPYRAQVETLKQSLGDEAEVETVHGFQGREKQVIVMSTVDNEIGDFVDDPKMLNVAVSRAQRHFVVVVADGQDSFDTNFGDLIRYIRYHRQLLSQSQVRSVFDLLYPAYANVRKEFLNRKGRGSVWDSENLAEAVIRNVLNSAEFKRMSLNCMRHVPLAWLGIDISRLSERERQFATNPWSHIDLLIFDNIAKTPLVAIEIDGWAFHRPGSLQSARDEVKNTIFQHTGLPLIRLSTTGSGEVRAITNALRSVLATQNSAIS